jgi:type IV secretion system protein VirB10
VLETAFHSTSAGYARAIVSRDIRGFDGTRVLIPRGSRLIGEYRGTIQPGQTRAVINWTRLIRGDGVTISLNSPAVDPMGRGGIRARVNNHLLERVTNTVLQSTIGAASSLLRSNRNSVILAVPGSADVAQDAGLTGDTLRTLSVPPATSISVFVAQDLEFDEDMGRP